MTGLANRFVRPSLLNLSVSLLGAGCLVTFLPGAGPDADFASGVDVGKVEIPGTTEVLSGKASYRIRGSGANIWNKEDAFHFAARKLSGDVMLRMDVEWVGAGKAKHRKACAMVRQDLQADAPYADVAVHGDGLIALQYRKTKSGTTFSIPTSIRAPATVQLERDGNLFTVSAAPKGQPFQSIASVTVELSDPVHVGLAVCAHDAKESETALFSNVILTNRTAAKGQTRVREASLEIVSVDSGERRLVYRAHDDFQAPNWSPDGKTFYINQRGRMYTVPAAGGVPKRLETSEAVGCNNDHGLSPDGKWLAISSGHERQGSKIYLVPASGGAPRRVTPEGPSYWHGWSPDGKLLAFCGKRGDNFDIYTIPADGGKETRLTNAEGLDDGPDYTPDGKFIYFNSERTGLMKIWRMHADGTHQEQVTTDIDYVDWFPHPSPDGKMLVFLSFDKSVKGHPADKDVVLRILPLSGGKPKILATLFGGQGTINVPSWSPDSKSIAFVSYRLVLP